MALPKIHTYKGVTDNITNLCRKFPNSPPMQTVAYRLRAGKTIQQAMEDPLQTKPTGWIPKNGKREFEKESRSISLKETPEQRNHFMDLRRQDIEKRAASRGMLLEVSA